VIGGDLQWVSQGQTVTPFDEAAFGANAGEIVGPIRTDFGWHVIKVEEKRPALDRKIDEMRPEIARQLLIQEKTLTMAREGADGLLEKAISEENLASLERPGPARHGTTGPFTRGSGQIPEVGVSAEGLKLAFGLTEDAPLASRVIQIDNALLIFRLKERVAAPSNPVASDLAPYRQEILTRKRQKAMQSWLDSERARAEQEGEIERNQSVLVDFFGIS
jgi:peptidyl-prolyl cis-trans isomerase D